jgi:hypothetical protein
MDNVVTEPNVATKPNVLKNINKIEIVLSVMAVVVVVSLILSIFALTTSTQKTEETIVHASVSGNIVVKKNLFVKGDTVLEGDTTLQNELKVTNFVKTDRLEILEKLTIGGETLLPDSLKQLLNKKEFLSLTATFSSPLIILPSPSNTSVMIDLTPWNNTSSEFTVSGNLYSKDIKTFAAALAYLPKGVYGYNLSFNVLQPIIDINLIVTVVPLLISYNNNITPYQIGNPVNQIVCDLSSLNQRQGIFNTPVIGYDTRTENFSVNGVASFPTIEGNSRLGIQILLYYSNTTTTPISWHIKKLQLNIFRIA